MAKKRRNGRIVRELRRDLEASNNLASEFMNTDPLSRLDASRSAETQALLNQRLGQSDVNSASYAGRRSADISDILGRFKSSLDGYAAPELTAMREQQQRGMDSAYANSRSGLMKSQARSFTRGASANAQLANLERSRYRDNANLEQDLFVKNADEKQRRLGDYSKLVSDTEAGEYLRGQQAMQNYSDLLKGDQDSRLIREQYNLEQERRDRAADVGSRFGLLGILGARRNQRQQNKLMASGRGVGGGGGGNEAYAGAIEALIQKMQEGM